MEDELLINCDAASGGQTITKVVYSLNTGIKTEGMNLRSMLVNQLFAIPNT